MPQKTTSINIAKKIYCQTAKNNYNLFSHGNVSMSVNQSLNIFMMRLILLITILTLKCTLITAQTILKLPAEEAHSLVTKANKDSLLVIDGRSKEMYQSGHIEYAINIDAYQENLKDQLDSIMDKEHLFIYCTQSTRSDSIISTLSLIGYKGSIIQLSDGITGWKESNFEVILPELNEEKTIKENADLDANQSTL
jgi:rhodanese-related sulfurtransferase